MAWRDTLQQLQQELAEARAERLRQASEANAEQEARRRQLKEMAEALDIRQLLEEMDSVLLKGQGTLEVLSSWDSPEEEEDGPDDDLGRLFPFNGPELGEEEEGEFLSFTLVWEEDGEREIAVDVGKAQDGTTYLEVNGEEVRPERPALEQALVEAFREELEL